MTYSPQTKITFVGEAHKITPQIPTSIFSKGNGAVMVRTNFKQASNQPEIFSKSCHKILIKITEFFQVMD